MNEERDVRGKWPWLLGLLFYAYVTVAWILDAFGWYDIGFGPL